MLSRISLLIIVLFLDYTYCFREDDYQIVIGGLFSTDEQRAAFKSAVEILNDDDSFPGMKLIAETEHVSGENTFQTYKSMCGLFQKGIVGLFGPGSIHSSAFVHNMCDFREIAHIEFHRDLYQQRATFKNIYPHPSTLSNIFLDLIEYYRWKTLIILYDNDESLLSVVSLLNLNEPDERTIVLRRLEAEMEDSQNYRPLLTQVKETGETKFVLACSLDTLEEVFKQLQQVGMMTSAYSYIITDLDMHTIDLAPFQYGGTNITGISMVDPYSEEVKQLALAIGEKSIGRGDAFKSLDIAAWKLKLESALIFDAVKLFAKTIYSEDMSEFANVRPISCTSYDSPKNGYTIMNFINTGGVKGLTGLVKCNSDGFREEFKVDLLSLSPGGILTVGEWTAKPRELKFQRQSYNMHVRKRKANLFDRTFTVLITMTPPYAMDTETTTALTGNDRYEGFCVDVIQKLSEILGFNYTFKIADGNGKYNETTRVWSGMIGQIIAGEADLAIADLTITSAREAVVEFTMPFMNLGISILYKKPEAKPPSLYMFVSPFSILVWVMLAISYFGVSLTIFVMARLSPTEWQNPYPCVEEPEYLVNQFSMRNSLWFTIGALMQQGTEIAPIAISTRTLSGIWWFFVLIMVSSYTANLAAFLTVESRITPFKNIKELAAQDKISYGAKKDGATESYFKESNVTEYKKVARYMSSHAEVMTKDDDESVTRVENGNYAFLMESTTIEYITERHCNLARVGDLLDDKGYGIAMQKDSPYRNDLSKAVLKLQESGMLTKLQIKWWKEKRGGGKCISKSDSGEAKPLNLINVGGVFLVLFIGSLLAIVGSFVELLTQIYYKAKREKLSFKEEFKKEMKFVIQFKRRIKEVNYNNSDNNDNKLINEDGVRKW